MSRDVHILTVCGKSLEQAISGLLQGSSGCGIPSISWQRSLMSFNKFIVRWMGFERCTSRSNDRQENTYRM